MVMSAVPLMVALGVFAVTPGSQTEDYVPDSGWQSAGDASFYEEWIGSQLRAMAEPSLTQGDESTRQRRRFRVLVLPSFSPAYAYRIDEEADGRTSLHWVLLDGAGGYQPGRIAEAEARWLTTSETAPWRRAVTNAHLRRLPRQPAAIAVCADGTRYVVELRDEDGAVFLTRHSCDLGGGTSFEQLLEETFRLRRPARARSVVSSYFSDADYPLSAMRNEEEGTVGYRLTIGIDGRVTDCTITRSSNSPTLDEATCTILSRRARFIPARDARGNLSVDSAVGRIRWVLPAEPVVPDPDAVPAAPPR